MTLPNPEPGLVVHFNYLWAREADLGRENARYARPCAIVVVSKRQIAGRTVVLLAPITHSAPGPGTDAIEIPASVKRHLGLNDQRSWLIADEVNESDWPGHDVEANRQGQIAYGFMPSGLVSRLKARLLEHAKSGRLSRIVR